MNRLHLSPAAKDDLDDIKRYVSEELENPQASASIVSQILQKIRVLRDHAYIGASLSSIVDVNSNYRYLLSGNYMTFYRVVDRDVYIDRILYGRKDYLRILFRDIEENK